MLNKTVAQIAEILGSKLQNSMAQTEKVSRIVIDSRVVKPSDIFVAIKGPTFDGHDFLKEARDKGALAVITEKTPETSLPSIYVTDTRKALHALARHLLDEVSPLVVAVTGSTGKTTTKEMIYCAMKEKFNVLRNSGNFNNDIGLPLTIFELEQQHEAVVLEMGMNNMGEISNLVEIAKPDIAVITNIGESHIGRLGSRENIFKAKMEICGDMDSGGTLIVNGDDPLLATLKSKKTKFSKIFTGCGEAEGHDVFARKINTDLNGTTFEIVHKGQAHPVFLGLPGRHHVSNALLAFAASVEAGVEPAAVIRGLEAYKGVAMRNGVFKTRGMTLVNDAYNASPSSMYAALEVLSSMKGRKIAVLGDMLELGTYGGEMHEAVGKRAAETGVGYLLATGEHAADYARGALSGGMPQNRVFIYTTKRYLTSALKDLLKEGDVVLFKGSRSTRMDEIYKEISRDE